jgi:hypothetical protein
MIFRRLNLILTTLAIGLITLTVGDLAQADSMRSNASGTGVFLPRLAGDGGDYFGPGFESELGENFIYNGSLDLIPIRELKFRFQNTGRGTDEEVLHEVMYEDGSTISSRFRGIVELDPVLDDDGNPTGQFTANWNGNWVYVKGTGRFRNVKGSVRVNAVNEPFSLTDFAWNFSFSWTGNLALPNRPDNANVVELSTQGLGSFDPANLGVGDPAMIPFPFIIGDGSGAGIYDGTPTGTATIGGMMSPDQHWGTAQSTRPGILSQDLTVWYPGVTGANPRADAGGALIHIMATDFGEIHFNYRYYFELDDVAGVIIGRAAFHVVGGTGMFDGAGGSVYVRVESSLADVTGLPEMPVAPFAYDFQGFVELAD